MSMIELIGDLGFCYGVNHAIETLSKAAEENHSVFLTHPLLHNKKENESLLRKNHASVLSPETDTANGAVVFSAHGHAPDEEKEYPHAHLYDATCPLILRRYEAISKAGDLAIVFLGKRGHQETVAFMGRFPDFLFVDCRGDIEKQLDAMKLEGKRTGLVPQTTVGKSVYDRCLVYLKAKTDLRFALPICPIYEKRHNDVLTYFAGKNPSQYYLVVCGDLSSSNANELLTSALVSYPGLAGTIAMEASDINLSDVAPRQIVLCSSTSASRESVLRLKAELEKKTEKDQ